MPAVLALLSSALWGTADFCGGLVSRRRPIVVVMVVSQGASLLALTVVGACGVGYGHRATAFGWGALAGVVGVVALACFYRGLSTGLMGVVAPIAATGVVLPVAVGIARGERPGALAVAGILLAVVGVMCAAVPAEGVPRHVALQPVALALVAAAGFGAVFVFLDLGAGDIPAELLGQRAVAVALLTVVLLAARPAGGRLDRRDLPLVVVGGLFDVSANGLFALAARDGQVSIVSVLSSLYPVVTVLLARHLLHERLGGIQLVGVVGALAGVVLLAAD